jgi:cyclopropane fatty-acyl-phospholipid synthase-like methyltransferase
LADAFGPSVLEIGCGTGRLSLPLARCDLSLTGVDVSARMLSRARARASAENLQITFIEADGRSLDTGSLFDVIVVPFNTLAHFRTPDDLEQLFARVQSQLSDVGAFAIDVANPMPWFMQDAQQPVHTDPIVLPCGTQCSVSESFTYDQATQIQHRTIHVRSGEAETRLQLQTRVFFPQELDAMLRSAGFRILGKFGSFGVTPFVSGCDRQLVLCCKSRASWLLPAQASDQPVWATGAVPRPT